MGDSTQYAKNPLVFAGELVYKGLTQWAETKLELVRNESTLGMAVTKYMTAFGDTVMVTPHRELFARGTAYNGQAYCVDVSDLQYRFLQGLDTHLEQDIQLPGLKQKTNEFRTWFTLKVGNEKKHGRLYGATSIS